MKHKNGVFGRRPFKSIPIARWAETEGRGFYPGNPSPTSIRNRTRFYEKIMYIMTMLKISYLSITIYDIIKHALAIFAWQCRGSGVLHTRRTTNKGFYGCRRYITRNENKIQRFYFLIIKKPIVCEPQSVSNIFYCS